MGEETWRAGAEHNTKVKGNSSWAGVEVEGEVCVCVRMAKEATEDWIVEPFVVHGARCRGARSRQSAQRQRYHDETSHDDHTGSGEEKWTTIINGQLNKATKSNV